MPQTTVHVQYRNATYYGMMTDYKRNGKGLLILDSSTIILAQWRQNQIEGMYVYISDNIRAYGCIVNGKLDGYNIISIVPSKIQEYKGEQKSKTIYGMFRNDKIYGRCVLIDNQNVMIGQFNNNQLQEILAKKVIRDREAYEILKEVFPNNMYTLDEFLLAFIKNFIDQLEHSDQTSRYEPCISYFSQEQKFYGFQEINKNSKKFGFLMFQNELISIGEHQNNVLEGIGRLYKNQHILDGVFKQGILDGIGIDYLKNSNKFTLGQHDGSGRLQKGFGFPIRQISQIRKEFHLRSIYFYNDLAVIGLKTRYDNLINNVFMFSKKGNQTSNGSPYSKNLSRTPSKRNDQISPLRNKLTKYQMESDYIEDNSPIKNKPINQYKPVDYRAMTYFTLDKQKQQQFPRRKTQQFPSNNALIDNQNRTDRYQQPRGYQRQNVKLSYNEILKRQTQGNTKFKDRQTEQRSKSKERFPKNSSNQNLYRNYPSNQGSQSGNNQNNNTRFTQMPIKNTKEFVKELQQEQKQKRIDLDKMYRQAGLYKRK